MSNITNASPVVTEDKLKDFYDDIKPFLGCPAYVTQEGDADYYSTDEKVVGRFTDGKPVYQKTFIISSVSIGNNFIPVGASVERYVSKRMMIGNLNIGYVEEYTDISANQGYSFVGYNNSAETNLRNRISINCQGDNGHVAWIGEVIVTVQYTKTTDSAATAVETKPTHYSTDEQVVGTWIDGKPLYQITYTFDSTTFPSADANIPLVANIDEIVDYRLICRDSKYHSGYIPTNLSHQKLWQSGVPFDNSNGLFSIINYTTTPYSIQVSGQGYYDWGNIDKAYLTVQYTKTTD